MLLNKFYINILFRVILIVFSSVLFGIVLQHLDSGYYYTLLGIIFLIILQVYMLVNQVNKTNSDLEKFFSSVQDHDSSVRFFENPKNSSFSKLHDRMNQLNMILQQIKVKNERTSLFLQSVVDHVDVGLLSFDASGKIEIYNRAVKKYLKEQQPKHLSTLKASNGEIYTIVSTIKPGHDLLYKILINNVIQNVLIKATELKFENNVVKLVSFQDITNELNKKELDSWQRIIRVLTHEIMNSISPITSLTSVISGYFKNKDNENQILSENINDQIIAKTLFGLNTIEETGKGLLEFVNKFRSLTSLPKPNERNSVLKACSKNVNS